MDERAALLGAIIDNPADDTTRLVFADWLDENGEPELVAREGRDPDAGGQLNRRTKEGRGWYRHAAAWLAGAAPRSWSIWLLTFPEPDPGGRHGGRDEAGPAAYT